MVIPEGEVPFVQRCDVDLNGIIDRADVVAISQARGESATDPDDPRDYDANGTISVTDARGCALACTFRRCASQGRTALLAQGSATQNPVGESGDCFQKEDLDGDGEKDFLGIYEYTGDETRGNNWNLQTVIIYEDNAGNQQVVAFPYTGQSSRDGEQIFQHVSVQPAGPVDLMPGGVMLSQPGIVSYRNNEPKTLYYIQNGQVRRAFFRVDD